MDVDVSGRVALVTGASRGIGRAVAVRLAAAGADVALGYEQDRDGAEGQARRIAATGRRAVAVGGNGAAPDGVAAMVGAVEERLGPIDILVSNAGIGPRHALEDITVEEWDRVLAVNLRAAFLLAQRVIPGMRARGWGRIVLISSVAAFTGGFVGPHYAASKAGQIGLMHALAGPVAAHGITVNAVAPALIEGGLPLPEGSEKGIPIGRTGQPEEVAHAVLALIGNGFITSQTLSVDGGVYPR